MQAQHLLSAFYSFKNGYLFRCIPCAGDINDHVFKKLWSDETSEKFCGLGEFPNKGNLLLVGESKKGFPEKGAVKLSIE